MEGQDGACIGTAPLPSHPVTVQSLLGQSLWHYHNRVIVHDPGRLILRFSINYVQKGSVHIREMY